MGPWGLGKTGHNRVSSQARVPRAQQGQMGALFHANCSPATLSGASAPAFRHPSSTSFNHRGQAGSLQYHSATRTLQVLGYTQPFCNYFRCLWEGNAAPANMASPRGAEVREGQCTEPEEGGVSAWYP